MGREHEGYVAALWKNGETGPVRQGPISLVCWLLAMDKLSACSQIDALLVCVSSILDLVMCVVLDGGGSLDHCDVF
jgi:hypothetical protein